LQSGQFEWMLTSFMKFYDHHPQEDSSIQSLLVVGILKATAVLKSVRITNHYSYESSISFYDMHDAVG